MTYAYDDYIQFPTRDLYDSAIMKMAIDAARDMYNRGEAQLKEFYKDYGDFTSPFAKDMARYGEMVGGVRDMINDAYAHGVDLLRTPQGRAMISQAINKINPAELNMMRSNAKTGYAYLDAMQKLRSQGKYSEAQELFDIAFNKGTNFSDFATSTPGKIGFNVWDRVSPIEAQSLRDLTYKSYEHRTARDLTPEDFKNDRRLKGMVYDKRYQYSGYLDSDLMKVAPGASMSLAGDPRAEFFRNEARKKVLARGGEGTPEEVEAQFQRDIADANTWALIDPTKKADEYELLRQQLKNTLESQRQGKALDFYYKMRENGADFNGDGQLSPEELGMYSMMKNAASSGMQYSYDPSTGMMVSPNGQAIEFTDFRQMAATSNRNERINANAGNYVQQMIDAEQAHIDLYNKYMKENKTGLREGEEIQANRIVTTTGAVAPGYDKNTRYTYKPIQKVSKHTEAEMSKLRSLAREAKQKISIYKRYLNPDGSANFDALIKAGYFDQYGQPTEYFMREINKLSKVSDQLPEDQRRQRADDKYHLYTGDVPSSGTEVHSRLLKDFAGDNKVKVPGLPNEMLKVNLHHYTLSAIRRGDITGENVYSNDSDVKRAQQWLRTNKVEGYVDDTTVNDAWIPNARGTKMDNDVFGDVLVDKKYFQRMFNDLHITNKEQQDKLLESLGIIPYEKQSTVQEDKKELNYEWGTYYSVPITKIYNSGIIQGDRNLEFRKSRYGQANAAAGERNSYAAGMQSTLIR